MHMSRIVTAVAFLAALVLTFFVLQEFQAYPLTTPEAPCGIISFEFAGTHARAQRIIASWEQRNMLQGARYSTAIVDARFIPSYTAALIFGSLIAARARRGCWEALGLGAATAAPLAGALDYLENAALLNTIDAFSTGRDSGIWPLLGAAAATPKWLIVIVTEFYCAGGIVIACYTAAAGWLSKHGGRQ